MSCTFCDKKMGGLMGPKKAADGGHCWSCQKTACSKCAPLYDGTDLGWVKPHSVCGKCGEALDRQKAKSRLAVQEGSKKEAKEAMRQAVSSLPEWSLPPAAPAKEEVSALPSRLQPVGGVRDEARRASRVLLKAVIENYADRDSYATPKRQAAEDDSSDVEDESHSSDLDTPIVLPGEEHAAPTATAAVTPVARLRASEDEQAQRRLSRGIVASLEELNNVAQSMNKSYTAPTQDEGIAAQLLLPLPAAASDLDFERELQSIDAEAAASPMTASSLGLNVSQVELGHVATPEARKSERRIEAELMDAEEFAAETGEEASDAELMTQINSLDSVLSPAVVKQVGQDPVAHIGDVLSALASAPSNTEASVAMHEDLMEVLQDVRRKERDARMVAMLDGVESKLRDSLVRVSTPKVRRKVEHKHNKYHAGQVLSARNAHDSCWYAAKIVEPDVEEQRYVVQFLSDAAGHSDRTQLCSEAADLRTFLAGNQVLAVYKADGLGLYQQAVVEHVTSEGLYKVRFASDGTRQACGEADVRPLNSATTVVAAASPTAVGGFQAKEAAVTPVRKQGANPNMVQGKDLLLRHIRFVEAWVAEQKRIAEQASVSRASDRRTLLVQAQLLAHVRKMVEVAASQVPPFEVRLQDSHKSGDEGALYAKLQSSVLAAAEHLQHKFQTLLSLVAHPKADGERLVTVAEKVARIKEFVTGSNKYAALI